jgi:hypothetical protein
LILIQMRKWPRTVSLEIYVDFQPSRCQQALTIETIRWHMRDSRTVIRVFRWMRPHQLRPKIRKIRACIVRQFQGLAPFAGPNIRKECDCRDNGTVVRVSDLVNLCSRQRG